MGFQPMLEAAGSLFKKVWSASPTLDVGTVASHGDWPSGFLDCSKFGEVAIAGGGESPSEKNGERPATGKGNGLLRWKDELDLRGKGFRGY